MNSERLETLPYPVPEALLNTSGLWFFDWVIPIFASLVILWAIFDSIRTRRLTWAFLFLLASLSTYWMETHGDWGQHLVYSPMFTVHHLLEWIPLKTPYDPVFMPFAYTTYWTIHALIVLIVGQWLVKRYKCTMLFAVLVMSFPVNYLWDFVVEGTAAYMGWWTYDPGIGAVLEWGNGGRITLIFTIGIMCTWPNIIAYWSGKPPVPGLNHIERFFKLERFTQHKEPSPITAGMSAQERYDASLNYEPTIPRWKFEGLRALAWLIVFNISFYVMLVMPLIFMRLVTGDHSQWIPQNIDIFSMF